MIVLKFVNQTAGDEVAITCDQASMRMIMAWYGAYYAGDDYKVYANGIELIIDQNGELIA